METSTGRGFYTLNPGWGTVWYETSATLPDDYWGKAMRGFEGTVQARVVGGSRPGDMMRMRDVLFFVSERFVEVLSGNGFTGWGTYDVDISGCKGPLPKYYGFVAYGVGGPILPEESEVRYGPDGGIIAMRRLVFDVSQWDGSDVFYIPPSSPGVLVTERVAKTIKKAKLKNCLLEPIEEESFGYFGEPWRPKSG